MVTQAVESVATAGVLANNIVRMEVQAVNYSPSSISIGNASSRVQKQLLILHVSLEGDEKSGYAIQCVEYPEALSQGKTKDEAKKNILEAISLVLEEEGKPIEDIVIVES